MFETSDRDWTLRRLTGSLWGLIICQRIDQHWHVPKDSRGLAAHYQTATDTGTPPTVGPQRTPPTVGPQRTQGHHPLSDHNGHRDTTHFQTTTDTGTPPTVRPQRTTLLSDYNGHRDGCVSRILFFLNDHCSAFASAPASTEKIYLKKKKKFNKN